MKKYFVGLSAVAVALGMSAFTTTADSSNTQSLWYKNGSSFVPYQGTPCPQDVQIQCTKLIPGVGERPIFTQPNDDSPLMTRP